MEEKGGSSSARERASTALRISGRLRTAARRRRITSQTGRPRPNGGRSSANTAAVTHDASAAKEGGQPAVRPSSCSYAWWCVYVLRSFSFRRELKQTGGQKDHSLVNLEVLNEVDACGLTNLDVRMMQPEGYGSIPMDLHISPQGYHPYYRKSQEDAAGPPIVQTRLFNVPHLDQNTSQLEKTDDTSKLLHASNTNKQGDINRSAYDICVADHAKNNISSSQEKDLVSPVHFTGILDGKMDETQREKSFPSIPPSDHVKQKKPSANCTERVATDNRSWKPYKHSDEKFMVLEKMGILR
ncbi:hypothetical protein NPIL_82231 [Nephila pilipes]|uniref:Uncharacterized protein n=1 Tax=Nephila pilipes TaxID=299642 RepID=A0A8X6R0T6_NEPPI|nr:hypothetical protein NPIL_82231 [Nephila pilipes]